MTEVLALYPVPRLIEKPKPGPSRIIAMVAERRGLTVDDLLGPSRLRPVAYARHEAMWELRQRTKLSLPDIARRLGRKDHTTALHGVRAYEKRRQEGA